MRAPVASRGPGSESAPAKVNRLPHARAPLPYIRHFNLFQTVRPYVRCTKERGPPPPSCRLGAISGEPVARLIYDGLARRPFFFLFSPDFKRVAAARSTSVDFLPLASVSSLVTGRRVSTKGKRNEVFAFDDSDLDRDDFPRISTVSR